MLESCLRPCIHMKLANNCTHRYRDTKVIELIYGKNTKTDEKYTIQQFIPSDKNALNKRIICLRSILKTKDRQPRRTWTSINALYPISSVTNVIISVEVVLVAVLFQIHGGQEGRIGPYIAMKIIEHTGNRF